jgi:hypothetical protein
MKQRLFGTGHLGVIAGLVGLIFLQCVVARSAEDPTAKPAEAVPATDPAAALYTQDGTDPTFESLIDSKAFPVGSNSTGGVKGSTIRVNKTLIEQGLTDVNPIPRDIRIHTLCNDAIGRKDFPNWTRWYQEDGHTQIFRLFAGETNVRNQRKLAARIEAFSNLNWAQGDWHEWSGRYTVVRPHGCCIFQVKNSTNDWALQIDQSDEGDINLQYRRPHQHVSIARSMTGKSFDLKVRDNGLNFEVYYNGQKVGDGSYDRPKGTTNFRWGMYLGEGEVRHTAIIMVTGAKFS